MKNGVPSAMEAAASPTGEAVNEKLNDIQDATEKYETKGFAMSQGAVWHRQARGAARGDRSPESRRGGLVLMTVANGRPCAERCSSLPQKKFLPSSHRPTPKSHFTRDLSTFSHGSRG